VDTTKTITHLSLCSGYEGIGLGLRRVLPNLREIAYVEIEAFAIANLVAKMEAQHLDPAPIFTDLKTFPYEQFRGKVSILSGGFPCQPFSAAGQRKATDDPRHLFPFIADGIQKCQPRIVFLENVQGILSCKTGDGEPVLQYVLRELEQMGYRATAGIFSAEEVGAPHQRKRVFILGYAQHNGLSAVTELRGNEEASNEWGKKESPTTRQSKGTSGPIDVPSVQGCSEGSESEELGYASSNGYEDRCTDAVREERKSQEGRMQEPKRGSNATPELANCSSQRGTAGLSGQDEWQEGKPEKFDYCSHRWPSRPSEQQYEWEEPRVVEHATSGRFQERQSLGEKKVNISYSDWQAESQLGRTTDGTTCRVDATVNRTDRLRLLGNGVVPATAAKAFVTLIQRLT